MLKRREVHRHVKRYAMVGAVVADFDAQGGNFRHIGEIRLRCWTARRAMHGALRQQSMAAGIAQPDIDSWRATHAVASDAVVGEGADDRFLHAENVFLDVIADALQIDQRVDDHLSRAVKSDLPAPVGPDHGYGSPIQNVPIIASHPLCKHRFVLANPQCICAV